MADDAERPRWLRPLRHPLRAQPKLAIRELGPADRAAALEICQRDAIGSSMAAPYIENLGQARYPGCAALGVFERATPGRLRSLTWVGPTIAPVGIDEQAIDVVVRTIIHSGKIPSSLVGRREQVIPMWRGLEQRWGPASEIRATQPLMYLDTDCPVPGDPRLRPARPDELGITYPASVAMFIEEVGYDPSAGGSYLQRCRELISLGRTYVIVGEDSGGPRVIFKADVGAISCGVAQIQGVWTAPDMRGRGIARAAMAAVIRQVRATHAPVVSLYVNDYNVPALALYRRLGFYNAGLFSTVMI